MRALVVLALCGCRGLLGIDDPVVSADAVGPGDAPPGVDAPDAALPPGCYGTTGWLLCLDAPPTEPIALGGTTIDTDIAPECLANVPASWTAAGQPDACVIAGATFMVSAPLVVTGRRPLVLLADATLQLLAEVDVASHVAGGFGPGANASACIAGNGNSGANGAGGGAGGSFVAAGGSGGNGTGGAGATTTPVVGVPDVLRGGCAGGRGGTGQGGGSGGVGGASGGAVFLVAGGSIAIASAVNASGAGARGGATRGGGGGGGSGGMIVVFAPSVDISGTLVANGGGGAEGANDAANGGDGSDPDPATALVAATGGAGGSSAAGNGGAGGAGTLAAQKGTNAANATSSGGGGGGGAVGVIRVLSGQSVGGTASPPAVP